MRLRQECNIWVRAEQGRSRFPERDVNDFAWIAYPNRSTHTRTHAFSDVIGSAMLDKTEEQHCERKNCGRKMHAVIPSVTLDDDDIQKN